MFYLIGLGLGDATDITVKGLRVVKNCSRVYLEAYTSVLTVGKEALVSRTTETSNMFIVDLVNNVSELDVCRINRELLITWSSFNIKVGRHECAV